MNSDTWDTTEIEMPKKIELKHGQDFGFNKEHVEIIKKGFIPKSMEDKWYIFTKGNWVFFHRAWTGKGIYKAEIKFVNNRYIIDEFYVERKMENYDNTDDKFDIRILHVIIEWGLLNVENRNLYLALYNKTEDDTIRLFHILGNFFISSDEIALYNLEKKTEYPCKDVFLTINNKIETFLFFLESLQYQKRITLNEVEDIFIKITTISNMIEKLYKNILVMINKRINSKIILYELSSEFSVIYGIIDNIEKKYMHYCINEERYLSVEDVIFNLTNSNNFFSLKNEIITKLMIYKKIFKLKEFVNEVMLRVDL